MEGKTFDRDTGIQVVIASLCDVFDLIDEPVPATLDENTVIVGEGAVLDSLGVVSLIVEIEQRLEQEYEVAVTLASERAMSQRSSPFRTVGVLADYMVTTIEEDGA